MTSPVGGRIGLVWTAALVLLGTEPVAAQPAARFEQGTHAFRRLLHEAGLKPIPSEEQFRRELNHPRHVLVISLGRQDWLRRLDVDLKEFHAGGGAFLGAGDQGNADEWALPYRYWVDGTYLRTEASSEKAYLGAPDFPFVGQRPIQGGCPVFVGLSRIATNRPSFLIHKAADFPPLAYLDGCVKPNSPRPASYLFAAGGKMDQGRVLLLADHSVFINEMMLPEERDNDNFDLARGAIDWLSEHGQRDRVLFMEDGVLVAKFDVPVKELPPPPLPTESELIKMFDKLLRNVEKEFSRTAVLRILIFTLALALGAFGLLRLMRSRHRIDHQVPLLAPALKQVAQSEPVADRRQRTILASGNFWEAAHGLARQLFDSVGHGGPTAAEPQVKGEDTAAALRSRQQQVRRLWRLATATRPWRISSHGFAQTVTEINTLKTALANGSLRLEHREKTKA